MPGHPLPRLPSRLFPLRNPPYLPENALCLPHPIPSGFGFIRSPRLLMIFPASSDKNAAVEMGTAEGVTRMEERRVHDRVETSGAF